MSLSKHHGIVFGLATSGLLWLALFLLLSGTSPVARADPGASFAKADGTGAACTQAQPCTLQTALTRATDGDTIYVAGGTYTGSGGAVITVTRSITLYGGWDGSTTTPPLRNPAAYPTTLDGENQRRGVDIGWLVSLILDGFVITRGKADYSGGGIRADSASLIIRNNEFVANCAKGDGGAIFVSGGTAQIVNNRISNNTALWAAGLRIINDANATIIGNEIVGNVAQISGGGVDVDCCGGSTPLVAQNWIADNHGGNSGGGVKINGTRAQLVNNIVARNQATNGAGVWLGDQFYYPVNATLINNTLVGHLFTGEAVWVSAYVTATLLNNTLTNYAVGVTNTAPMSSTLAADHNLFWNTSDRIIGTNAVLADPLLDAAYRLTRDSPARDAGTAVPVTTDFDGDHRPIGGYDIGADEFTWRLCLPLLMKNGHR